jgi:hypothetical protein
MIHPRWQACFGSVQVKLQNHVWGTLSTTAIFAADGMCIIELPAIFFSRLFLLMA